MNGTVPTKAGAATNKTLSALLLSATILLAGCPDSNRQRASINTLSGKTASSTQRTNSLLESVTATLAQLPERAVSDLTPPTVVVDATRSSDGQDVMARLVQGPIKGAYNVLEADNGRFRSNDVRPGDIAKYFYIEEGEYERELMRGRSRIGQMKQYQNLAAAAAEGEAVDLGIITVKSQDLLIVEIPSENRLVVNPAFPASFDRAYRVEVWRDVGDRLLRINRDLGYYEARGIPRLGWEPSPDRAALVQIVERLNVWMRQGEPQVEWQMSELLNKLPDEIRSDPKLSLLLSRESLERSAFSLPTDELKLVQEVAYEGQLIQAAMWQRDIGRWVGRGAVTAEDRCRRIFDWVVRNIQLEPNDDFLLPRRPWQTLLAGRGSAENRAWVFVGMCRQRGWPAVVLRLTERMPDGDADQTWRTWCGVEIGGQLYLFDPALGLPIPGPDGKGIATLAQVRETPDLLRQLDLPDAEYPVDATGVAQVAAFIVADPFALSRRARLLENELAGDDVLRLAVDADEEATWLADRYQFDGAELWQFPYRVLLGQLNLERPARARAAIEFEAFALRPQLYKARVLHFRGRNELVADAARGNLENRLNDHDDAIGLYQNVRPSAQQLARMQSSALIRPARLAKVNASYWVGLLSYDLGHHRSALDWFDSAVDSPLGTELWAGGVTRNRALTLHAEGDTDQAIATLRSGSENFAQIGNRLLAERWQVEASPE